MKALPYGFTRLYFPIILLFSGVCFSSFSQEKQVEKSSTQVGPLSINLFGRIKADAIYDFDQKSGDRINYSQISTSDTEANGHFRMHARETRLGLKLNPLLDEQDVSIFIEGDFFGGGTNSPSNSEVISNSSSFRLRHAYLKYNNWLVGQTWSNYTDSSSFLETLDFSNETGQSFIRQAQIRFTKKINSSTFSVSVENPETDLLSSTSNTAQTFESIDPLWDATAKVKLTSTWGYASLQLLVRQLKAYTRNETIAKQAYGIGISGKINTISNSFVKFHFSQGDGIGRYIQESAGLSGFIVNKNINDTDSYFELIRSKGGYVGLQIPITSSLRANLNTGYLKIQEPLLIKESSDSTEQLRSSHVNLLWTPVPNLTLGIEHSYVSKTSFAGNKGRIKRLQLSTIYRF